MARYTRTAIALHWGMAVLVVGLLGVGVWMTGLKPSPTKIEVYTWHKWFGLTVLLLLLARILWRLRHAPPPLPDGMPAWQRRAAAASHGLLYLLLAAMPLTGWLQNSAAGFPLSWFGLFKVPALIPRDQQAFAFWQGVHEALAWTLVALLLVHVAAAVKHHVLDRDDVLRRMWPARARTGDPS